MVVVTRVFAAATVAVVLLLLVAQHSRLLEQVTAVVLLPRPAAVAHPALLPALCLM